MVDSIVVVANMNAKRFLFDKSKVKNTERIIGNKGKVIKTYNPEDLEDAIYYILKYKPQVVYPAGGDGTKGTFCSRFFKRRAKQYRELSDSLYDPLWGLPPEGTWDIWADHLGIKQKDAEAYLRQIVNTDIEDLATQDLGLIKATDDRKMETFGFSFGMGLPVTFLEEYYKAKYLKAAKVGMMIAHLVGSAIRGGEFYKKFDKRRVYKVSNGKNEEKEVNLLGLMAQTVPGVGLPKSNIFYKATHTDKFHVMGTELGVTETLILSGVLYLGKVNLLRKDLLFSELDLWGAISLLPLLYTRRTDLLSKEKIIDLQTGHYRIQSEGEPFPYQVYGDLQFMGKKFKANDVVLEHGGKINAIKYLR